MKTNIIISARLLAFFIVSFLGKTYSFGDNTKGNVDFYLDYDMNTKEVVMTCNWHENLSTIEPIFYYDTIPNSYRFVATTGIKYPTYGGGVSLRIKGRPCTVYFVKLRFKDGSTGNTDEIERSIQTRSDMSPEVLGFKITNIGFHFVEMEAKTNGACEGYEIKIFCQKMNDNPELKYTEQRYGQVNDFGKVLTDLEPNTNYQLIFMVSNSIGNNKVIWGFTTPSNLPPVVDSKGAISVTENSVRLSGYLDTKNTTTKWGFELGENVVQDDFYGWNVAYGGEGMIIMDICNLKSNTIYFFRPVSKNDWGHDEGQTRIFKTNSSATMGVRELTFDDLLRVSSKTGGLTIFVEKSAEVIVSSINGQKIGTYNVADELSIDNVPVGTYVIQTNIGGKHLVKKAMVF
jgi:hypothetical protein